MARKKNKSKEAAIENDIISSIFDDGDLDPLELLGNNSTSKRKKGKKSKTNPNNKKKKNEKVIKDRNDNL